MLATNVLSRPLPGSVTTLSLKKRSKLNSQTCRKCFCVFAFQRLKRDNLLIKNGIEVPEKQLSLQGKYSFTEYAKIWHNLTAHATGSSMGFQGAASAKIEYLPVTALFNRYLCYNLFHY